MIYNSFYNVPSFANVYYLVMNIEHYVFVVLGGFHLCVASYRNEKRTFFNNSLFEFDRSQMLIVNCYPIYCNAEI